MSQHILDLASSSVAPSWIVGPRNFAMDRIVPEVDLIRRPGARRHSGRVIIEVAQEPTWSGYFYPNSRVERVRQRMFPQPAADLGNGFLLDTRRFNSYFNWSHHVNSFLPLAIYIRASLGYELTVGIMGDMPGTLTELYDMFGFQTVSTNGRVRARHIVCSPELGSSFGRILGNGQDVYLADFHDELEKLRRENSGGQPFGKLFISRRGSRTLSNETEIAEHLAGLGFTKVYAEDFSARDQFRMWHEATHCVAIHGAGIAPIQYRGPDRPPIKLVEICPVGHVTPFFEVLCDGVKGHYAAVRGKLKPSYVEPLFKLDTSFVNFSEDSFEVDPFSLDVALHFVEGGEVQADFPRSWNLQKPV